MGGIEVRPYQPGDEHGILTLHNSAFAGHPDRALAHWHWKYRDNPLGRTELFVAVDGERYVGVYAGVTLPFQIEGEPCLASNQIDVATGPQLRSTLGSARLVAELGRRYFETYAGGETLMVWGFPEPALQRLGRRLLGYQILQDVIFLMRAADPDAVLPPGIEIRPVEHFGAEVDALWQRCARELNTGLIRDARYLEWRYAAHPDHHHLLLEARDAGNGELRGLAVLRSGGWDESLCSLLDWLVPREDREAEAALIAAALRETSRRGLDYLACWFPPTQLFFHRLQVDHGFFAQATPYQECFRPYVKGRDRRWFYERWYHTMGDIDFF